jgi:hypothetical protein
MKRKRGDDCNGFGDSTRALAASAGIQFSDLQAEAYRMRDILLGIAGGAFGGLRMSGWNPIGGVVGGIVGGAIAAVESLC